MTAVIALLYDPACLDGEEPAYEFLVPILGLSSASQFLRGFAVKGEMGVTRAAIRKYLSKETLALFKKIMLKYLSMKVTQRAVIAKSIPIVGGIVGGAWNYAEVRLVGKRAIEYFSGDPLSDDGSPSGSPSGFGPEPSYGT